MKQYNETSVCTSEMSLQNTHAMLVHVSSFISQTLNKLFDLITLCMLTCTLLKKLL